MISGEAAMRVDSFEPSDNFLTGENQCKDLLLSWGHGARQQPAGAEGKSESKSMGPGKAQRIW